MSLTTVKRWLPLALVTALLWQLPWLSSALLRYAPEPLGSRAGLFSEAVKLTLLLTIVAAVAGLVVGVVVGLAEISANAFVRRPAEAYVWIVRGTPLLVQILFVYFALPALIPGLVLDEFTASATALALNIGAYNAEVVRAGVLAVPRGQTEAAFSLGLSKFQAMRRVILPQALRLVVPALVNNAVALLKDSSLASVIGVYELSLAGNRIASETFQPVPVLTTIAGVYLVLTTVMTGFASLLEKLFKAAGEDDSRR